MNVPEYGESNTSIESVFAAEERIRRQRVAYRLLHLPFGPLTEAEFIELRSSHYNGSPTEVVAAAEDRGVEPNDVTTKPLEDVLSDLDAIRARSGDETPKYIDLEAMAGLDALVDNLRGRMVVAVNIGKAAVEPRSTAAVELNRLDMKLCGDDDLSAIMKTANWEQLAPYVDGKFADGYQPEA